ncbi:MAG: hypothetical protein CVU10_09145 [Bacteroidetes bacterium HGW-Bacteroidetes-5]|jgi:hypothetical protein|nr:MAG: hypothetical protein CVU10_09145 [Bacteroidetes bacterium HGW-Bacteroidetes-5]
MELTRTIYHNMCIMQKTPEDQKVMWGTLVVGILTAGKPISRGLLNNPLCSKRAHSAGRSELVSG